MTLLFCDAKVDAAVVIFVIFFEAVGAATTAFVVVAFSKISMGGDDNPVSAISFSWILSPIFSLILHFYSKSKFHWPSCMCNENHSQNSREGLNLKKLSHGDARVNSEKNESTGDIDDATLP